MADFLKIYRWPLVLAFVVGVISVGPAILAPLALGNAYQGVQYAYIADEGTYRARIHEVLEGHWSASSPFAYEYKDASVIIPPVNEWFYAIPASVFGLSATLLASKFVLPALLFLLAFFFTKRLIGNGDDRDTLIAAIAAGLLVTLGIEFVDYGYLFSLFMGASPRLLLWTRLVNPIMGAVQLFALLIFLQSAIERSWRYIYIAAGVALASMIGYFFSFTVGGAVFGALLLAYLVKRDFGVARELFGVFLVFLACTAPYWLYVFTTLGRSGGEEAALKAGMEFMRAPVLNKALLATTLIVGGLALYAARGGLLRRHMRAWIFIGAMVLGSWIAFNQQILTGRVIWYYHFVQYTVPLAYVSLVVASYFSLGQLLPRLWKTGAVTVSALCVVYGLYSITSFFPNLPAFAKEQEYAPVFTWLNQNAGPDCVVFAPEANDQLNKFIAAYTNCDTYTTGNTYAAIPRERILHNYFLELRFRNVAPDEVRAYALSNEEEVRVMFYNDWSQLYGRGRDRWFLSQVDALETSYQEFVKGDLDTQLHQYRIDYILTHGELGMPIKNLLPHVREVAEFGTYYLYDFGT